VPCLPQERDDAGPDKATLLAKPGLVFVADREPHRVGGACNFWDGWPLALRKPQQRVDSRARDRVPVRPRRSTTAFPEQPDRIAQILRHLRFAHIRDQDIPPRKMVEEPTRIGAIVPDHHRAILLAGQYDPEFGDQFTIGIRHRWLLCWSNDRRGSSRNNAEQGPPSTGGIMRDLRADAAFLHIIDTSRLLDLD
jgi:hypothetical protein